MKFFSCIIFCLLLFKPAVIVNSQSHVNPEKVKLLQQKEAENRDLKLKIKANEQEINLLLGQLIEKKTEVKKIPIYKRIFISKRNSEQKKHLPQIIRDPVPTDNPEIRKIDSIDTVSVAPAIRKKDKFFKRIFKIFKRKK